ncbi:uncharacterized protein LOC106074981 [Biomphalaria glabrata]|uniref:Uncharacterized protein LOC106074981 n=1 Tax=Biomphalaria glabrata TaxID=6526 RepID=A0A9W2ZU64_BIOGL|nr:uncharacterized protein LOC106074981 [Biomphalaria glabrata]
MFCDVHKGRSGQPRTATNDESTTAVLKLFQRSPQKSLRQAARESDVSASTVLNILRKGKFRLYIARLVQQLSDDDPDRRLEFCEWVQERVRCDSGFMGGIIWSDEAQFKLNGTVNRHNCEYWAEDNPRITVEKAVKLPGHLFLLNDFEELHVALAYNVHKRNKGEIIKAIKNAKNGKAPGPDGIPVEALKADPKISAEMLLCKIWEQEKVPKFWKLGYLIKLLKKGDLTQCNNWRGIMLLSFLSKVLTRIILECLKDALDKRLRPEQAGFCKEKSCTDYIATLRIIIEQSIEWQSPLYMTFVDFEKAFDSIDREVIWRLMNYYGISTKFTNIIKQLYDDSSCQVHNEDLDFANDICLLSHTQQNAQTKLTRLSEIAKKTRLLINKKKTEVMRINNRQENPIMLQGENILDKDHFTYLGSRVGKDGKDDDDILIRINKARFAFSTLQTVWRSKALSLHNKKDTNL